MIEIEPVFSLGPYEAAALGGVLGEATTMNPPNVGSAYPALLLVNGRMYTRWRSSPGVPGAASGPDIYTSARNSSSASAGSYGTGKGTKVVAGKAFECSYSSAAEWWSCQADPSSGKRHWFRIHYEVPAEVSAVSAASLSWGPSEPKVYQEFDLSVSGTVEVTTQSGTSAEPGEPETASYAISSFAGLSSALPGLELEGDLKAAGNRFREEGSKRSQGNRGASFDYTRVVAEVSVLGFSPEDGTLEVEAADEGRQPKCYAGVEVGEGFSSRLVLVRYQRNEYMAEDERVRTVLENPISLSGISPKVFSGDSEGFDYESPNGYGKARYEFAPGNGPTGLAENPFLNAGLKKSYYAGETFGEEGEDLYAGSLLYADGAYVPISDIETGEGTASLSCRESPADPWRPTMEITMETTSPFMCRAEWPFPWFGGATLSCEYEATAARQLSPDVASAELSGAKDAFMAGDPFLLGDGAVLRLFDSSGKAVIEASGEEISYYVTSWPSGYGAGAESARDGSVQTAYLSVGPLSARWDYRVGWTESGLAVEGPSKRTYYMEGPGSPELDLAGLSVRKVVHSYDGGSWKEEETALSPGEYSVTPPSFSALDPTIASRKAATVRWSANGEEATGSFEVAAYLLACLSLSWSGTLSEQERKYWDNGADLFVPPSSLSYSRHWNDGSSEEVADPSSEIAYFTGASASVPLTPETPMDSGNGSYVYAVDRETGAKASYRVEFSEDRPSSLYPDPDRPKPELVLGNRLSSIRGSLFLKAKWESGLVEDSDYGAWDFVDLSIQMSEPSSIAVSDAFGAEFELAKDSVSYKVPEAILELDPSKVRTAYTNGADSIDLRALSGRVSYEGAEYSGSVSPSFDGLLDSAREMVPSVASGSRLEGVALDGSKGLDIDMGSDIEAYPEVTFECLNEFDPERKASAVLGLSIYAISDVEGIALVNARTSYEVGDEFLGDGDDGTVVRLFFKGADGKRKSVEMPLSSRLVSLNVYPLPGTVFTSPAESRAVTVSSASDSTVRVEYSIRVASRLAPSDAASHAIVAVWADRLDDPSGGAVYSKYALVGRLTEDGREATQIGADGSRAMASGLSLSSPGVTVYGYLDRVGEEGVPAKAVLFDDWLPPLEGMDNLTFTFPSAEANEAGFVDSCRFGILFGNNNAKNRLFVSGNPEEGNMDWHTGEVLGDMVDDPQDANGNFAYFEDDAWCRYGETDNSVVGYDIVSDAKLLVLKGVSDKETTVYFRGSSIAEATTASGDKVTGINGEAYYEDAFPLYKGNNTAAGVSPFSMANLNGDTLFLSSDGSLMGLDVEGIVGDSQHYASTRSKWIDGEIAKKDPSEALVWADGKKLVLSYPDCAYLTDSDTLSNGQYEWWKVSVEGATAFLRLGGRVYIGDGDGNIVAVTDGFEDVRSSWLEPGDAFASYGGSSMVLSAAAARDIPEPGSGSLVFEVLEGRLLCSLGAASNSEGSRPAFLVRPEENCLMLMPGMEEAALSLMAGDGTYYLIGATADGDLLSEARRWKMSEAAPIDGNPCWKLVYESGGEADLSRLYSANLAREIDFPCEVASLDRGACTLTLARGAAPIVFARASSEGSSGNLSFRAKVSSRKPVSSWMVTKPLDFGSYETFKTVWQWTVAKDSKSRGDLEVSLLTNKERGLPALEAREAEGLDFATLDFESADFDLSNVPRVYSSNRIKGLLRFASVAFRSERPEDSPISSVSIVYSVSGQAYGGD